MRDLQKTANDHDVREKMDHLISVSEVMVKEDRRCQGEHRKARRHLPHTKTKDQQQPTANFEGNGNCPAQRGQGQAHAADVRCRRSEGSELAEAAHEKRQTDKYATNQWQKSCNFHVRLSSRCLRRLSGDRKGDDLTTVSRVISLYFTIVKYHCKWSPSMKTKASRKCELSIRHGSLPVIMITARTEPSLEEKAMIQQRDLLSSQALYLVIKVLLGASSGDHSLNEVFRKNSDPVLDPMVSRE